jgi:hypothetical protein
MLLFRGLFKNNVLRPALHKIKVNHLPQEKVKQGEIITDIKSWLGREGGILTQCTVPLK